MVTELFKTNHPLYEYQKVIYKFEKKLNRSKKHNENVNRIIKILALNGVSTTYDIAKQMYPSNQLAMGDNVIRRIITGRKDKHETSLGKKTEKKSLGIQSFHILKEVGGSSMKYFLTEYGMLYAIKSINFSSKDFAKITKNNKNLFPLIFGKYDYLSKNKICISFLKRIASNTMLDLQTVYDAPNPYHDIMTHLVAQNSYHLNLDKFRSFVQLWFFTELMWFLDKERTGNLKKWSQIIHNDSDIYSEYYNFFYQISELVEYRHRTLRKVFASI